MLRKIKCKRYHNDKMYNRQKSYFFFEGNDRGKIENDIHVGLTVALIIELQDVGGKIRC
jgi:hypothetical protein